MKYPNPKSMATMIIIQKAKAPKKKEFNGDNHGGSALDGSGRTTKSEEKKD